MKKISIPIFLLLILLPILSFSACSQVKSENTLKIAVLPVLDGFPLYVANSQGYFTEQGVKVELIPVASAPERDQLMQSGQIDGMVNELVATLIYNKNGSKIQNLRIARAATAQYPLFRILGAPGGTIKTVQDLKGVPIGISQGTVIEYTTERMLQKAGLKPEEIKTINVPKIPDRTSLLESGQLKAANMPDPLASLSIKKGAPVIIDDTSYPEVSFSVYSFKIDTIKNQPEALKAFMRAIEKAVKEINSDKGKWKPLLTKLKLVPQPLMDSYVLPDYPLASVPNEKQFADALAWVKEKDLVDKDLTYNDSINSTFLP
jgi:NitT/TauT family transport system substrate-binding protein